MEKALSYLTPEGYTVFTSHYLKNKGTCCKSACLHCPYGYTVKKLGIQFSDVGVGEEDLLQSIILESGSASVDWRSFFPDNIKLVQLKGKTAGIILKNHIVVKHLFLLPHFQHQNLSKELIESYYFI